MKAISYIAVVKAIKEERKKEIIIRCYRLR